MNQQGSVKTRNPKKLWVSKQREIKMARGVSLLFVLKLREGAKARKVGLKSADSDSVRRRNKRVPTSVSQYL